MNLKYYLRGLGIGVVVTAVIMSITMGGRTESLSNAEIRERAKALGMVEPAGVLTELEDGKQDTKEPQREDVNAASAITVTPSPAPVISSPETPEPSEEPEGEESILDSPSPEAEASEAPSPIATPTPLEETKASPTPQSTEAPEGTPTVTPASGGESSGTSVIIVVRSGESSYTICKKLEDAGIVASASALDSYLCGRGYDTKLRTGTFEIPVDAGPEEIAKILISG